MTDKARREHNLKVAFLSVVTRRMHAPHRACRRVAALAASVHADVAVPIPRSMVWGRHGMVVPVTESELSYPQAPHTKKFELLKVSSFCTVSASSRMSSVRSSMMMPPNARPVRDAAMPSPTYLELQQGQA